MYYYWIITRNPTMCEFSRRLPGAGLKPAWHCCQRILSPLAHRREHAILYQYVPNYKVILY